MIDNNKKIGGFIFLDPINNVQEYIVSADLETMRQAKAQGCIFLVEYLDGTRDIVDPEEINLELMGEHNSMHLVRQEEFVPIMESMLELMEESMTPAVALLSVAGQKKTVNQKFEDFRDRVNFMLDKYKPNIEEAQEDQE